VYTVSVENISGGVIVIQDPYPTEGRLTMPVAPGETEVQEMMDSQYDRIKPQLDWHQIEGRILYTAFNGPASKIINDSSVPGQSVKDALENIVAGYTLDVFALAAGRQGADITDVYLRGPGGVPTNLAGYVMAFDARIVAISLATTGAETWTLEIRKNNSATVIASLSSGGADKAYDDTIAVDVDAGDELQFYCNGTAISAPSGTIILRRR